LTAVKICGLTREADVALACRLGASWIGFVFASDSPRRVEPTAARRLAEASAPGVMRVGVFVSETPAEIEEAVDAARLDLIQFHRPLSAEDFAAPRPIVAVARVTGSEVEMPRADWLGRCRALLLDSASESGAGGTGLAFDWRLAEGRAPGVPILLAGGLTFENVGAAVRRVRPWGVDVASGVESSPGRKDPLKMERFFDAVRQADADAA
jgi:phosphoribosylanthranilate isomerase